MKNLNNIISNLESLLHIYKELKLLNENFKVPMKCLKKITNSKLLEIKQSMNELINNRKSLN